jgi:hypothetical protein
VLLTEVTEGGWGIAGTAFGREQLAALATESSSTASKISSEEDSASSIPGIVDCDYFDLSSLKEEMINW